MNFLGIGPGEIFFILILILVVVGPERLPEFARTAGRFVVRARDWVARSPDAQMVMRAREELEQELNELRKSLTDEVETVRKELESVRGDLAEATKMVEESAEEVAKTRIDLDALQDEHVAEISNGAISELANETNTIAPPDAPAALPDTSVTAPDYEVDPGPLGSRKRAVAERRALETPASDVSTPTNAVPANGQPVPRSFKPGQAPADGRGSVQMPAPQASESLEALNQRLEALGQEFSRQVQVLSAEIQALRAHDAGPVSAAEHPALVLPEPVSAVQTAPVEARRRCKGRTRSGELCAAAPLKGQDYCRAHTSQRVLEEVV